MRNDTHRGCGDNVVQKLRLSKLRHVQIGAASCYLLHELILFRENRYPCRKKRDDNNFKEPDLHRTAACTQTSKENWPSIARAAQEGAAESYSQGMPVTHNCGSRWASPARLVRTHCREGRGKGMLSKRSCLREGHLRLFCKQRKRHTKRLRKQLGTCPSLLLSIRGDTLSRLFFSRSPCRRLEVRNDANGITLPRCRAGETTFPRRVLVRLTCANISSCSLRSQALCCLSGAKQWPMSASCNMDDVSGKEE